MKDEKCGCYYCIRIFPTSEIVEWCDEPIFDVDISQMIDDYPDPIGFHHDVTAICPHCEVDAVISESCGAPLTIEFLTQMNEIKF